MITEVFNIDEALERIGGDRDFLFELLNEFIKQMNESLPALGEAVKNADFDGIKIIAHKLRGSAGNLSVSGMYQALSEIETLAVEGRKDMMARQLLLLDKQRLELAEFLQTEK
jgi:HPt (histidine-containing phosphotransfer) domain-containing protein